MLGSENTTADFPVGRLRGLFKVQSDQQLQRPCVVKNCNVVVDSLILTNYKINSGLIYKSTKNQTVRNSYIGVVLSDRHYVLLAIF